MAAEKRAFGVYLQNALAEALGLSVDNFALTIEAPVDGLATITTSRLMSTAEVECVREVLARYALVELDTPNPQPPAPSP